MPEIYLHTDARKADHMETHPYSNRYVIDKYQVTRQYSKSPIQYGQRSRSTTHLLFNAGYVGQVGYSIRFARMNM